MAKKPPAKLQTRSGRFYDVDGEKLPSVTTILSCINKPALVNWAAKVERELILKVSADLYEDAPPQPKMTRAGWLLTLTNRLGGEKAHQKELAKAGEIGSQCHELIEWTLKGELCYDAGPSPRISDAAQWAFMAWQDWRNSVKLKPILVEQTVYSKKYGYAGTMDLLCEIELAGLIEYFTKRNQPVPDEVNRLVRNQEKALVVPDWKTGKAIYPEAHLQNAAYRQALREMGHSNPELGLLVRLPKVESDPEFEVVVAKPEAEMFPRFLDVMSVWKWCQIAEQEYQEKQAAATPPEKIEETLRESLADA